ncbi:hypothetical protein [uncultured Aliiroseovarius sp.]|uniref:hypothetical protein n=1 Tax=uncultured Aliiroseovarius sp. TaxID=1658783 RepID=UPI002598B773|nr:hypothetical protein [uncultured Aliiroseovarius sp.]
MEILADIMLGFGAIGAAIYCLVLSKRLRRFNNLQNGMGGAVAVLSAQVDDMTTTLNSAQDAAAQSADILTDLTRRAEAATQKLELMMASLHDLPEHNQTTVPETSEPAPAPTYPNNQRNNSDESPVFFSHRVLEAAE